MERFRWEKRGIQADKEGQKDVDEGVRDDVGIKNETREELERET